jgi:phosphotriesterase-related protein
VLGPLDTGDLGFTLSHQHVCNGFAGMMRSFTDIPDRDATCERAVSRTSRQTNVPIMTHTWAFDQIGELQVKVFKEEGVDLNRVCIGHSNDTTNFDYLTGLLKEGVWLGLDRYPEWLPGVATWQERTETLERLIDTGWGHHLMLAHDWDSSIGFWGSDLEDARQRANPDNYLFITRRVLPMLKSLGATDSDVHKLMVNNPRRFLRDPRSRERHHSEWRICLRGARDVATVSPRSHAA